VVVTVVVVTVVGVSGGSVVVVGSLGSVVLATDEFPGFDPALGCPLLLSGSELDDGDDSLPVALDGSVVSERDTPVPEAALGAVSVPA